MGKGDGFIKECEPQPLRFALCLVRVSTENVVGKGNVRLSNHFFRLPAESWPRLAGQNRLFAKHLSKYPAIQSYCLKSIFYEYLVGPEGLEPPTKAL